jgi:hypothetical protein
MTDHSSNNCMCIECGETGGMQKMMNKGISENGFIVIPIVDANTPFAYSVGLTESYGKPELIIICNMDPIILARIVHNLAEKIKEGSTLFDVDGTIENAITYNINDEEVLGSVGCRTVKEKYKTTLMCQCCKKYGNASSFSAKQIIVGDLNGKLPWEKNCDTKWFKNFNQKQLW